MSLLNDMLRDLSLTQKNADALPVSALELQRDEQRELLNQSSVIKPEPGKLWPSVAVFIGVFSILWLWTQGKWLPESEQITIGDPVVSTEVKHKPVMTQANVEHKGVDQVDANKESVVELATAPTDSALVLNERLAALETAITKLSGVVEESQTIAADTAATESPDEGAIPANAAPVDFSAAVDGQQVSVSIRDPFAQDEQSSQTEHQMDNAIPAGAHLSVKPNPVFLDQREAEQGRQLAALGQASDAIIALQAFIANAQTPIESTRALLDIFAEQENVVAIENLLVQAGHLSQLDKQFYAAKVAIIQQREDLAIDLLEARITEADAQESYRALLAGLYQRAGKYSEAASAYRRLLGSFGEKPSYWLGFALAQDSLSQRQIARQAYLRVAEYADLQPEVRAYIQQRLAALQ